MERNILEFLEKTAKKYPEKIACYDDSASMSFSELLEKSKQIGTYVASVAAPRSPIAVITDKTVFGIASFFGAVYAGCFYVPIGSDMSVERLRKMMNTLKPALIICDENNKALADTAQAHCDTVLYDEIAGTKTDENILLNIRENALDTDPLYAEFTSGSTGVPKCVLVSHHSAIDFFSVFVDTFSITKNDVIGNQAPFDFDVSAKDIYSCIISGATMYLIDKKHFSFPKNLIGVLNENKITTIIWAVSALSIVASLGGLRKEAPEFINKVLFSGEVMPIKHLNEWMRSVPKATFVNLYGPTEITCNCTYFVARGDNELTETLPIGKPFTNDRILLLDGDKEVKDGEIGEICVLGSCLALGYYNNPEQTAKAFVQNPLNTNYPERMYRTGDLGKYLPDGNLKFMSRKDFQIKHMGHRIELGEVEAAVSSIEEVRFCCCLYDEEAKKIYLFHESDGELTPKDILQKLSNLLPKYMFPNKIVALEKMPMNSHNKMDRVRLKKEYISGEKTNG